MQYEPPGRIYHVPRPAGLRVPRLRSYAPIAIRAAIAVAVGAYTLSPGTRHLLADVPLSEEVRSALERNANAIEQITADWSTKRTTSLAPKVLYEALQIGESPDFLLPRNTRFVRHGTMFYALRDSLSQRPTDKAAIAYAAELAFDGRNFYEGTSEDRSKAQGRDAILRILPYERSVETVPDGCMVILDYFEAAGFQVPNTARTIRQPANSLLLKLLDDGAAVTEIADHEEDPSTTVLVTLADSARIYRFSLDKSLGYAVREQQTLTRDGRLLMAVANSDFVPMKVSHIWLPKRSLIRWHSWYTTPPGRAFKDPLFTEELRVAEIHQEPVDVGLFVLNYTTPGTVVGDGRLPGADTAANAVVDYRIPADVKDLNRVIDEAVRGRPRTKLSTTRVILIVGNVVLAAVVMIAVALRWRRHKRDS